MKIQLFHTKGGGPGVFMKRLSSYLKDHHGVRIVDENPDLYFSSVWRGTPPPHCPIVHRADNVYFDLLRNNRTSMNAAIKHAIKRSNGTVYQSLFSRNICESILKIQKPTVTVIHNAIDQSKCAATEPFDWKYKHVFVACALWRPLKRPYTIAKAFIQAGLENSKLFIIGPVDKEVRIKDKRITYTGQLDSAEIDRYYKSCTGVIHCARLDACPNVVVEALSYGKPVVCNNAGGTPEIVGKDGVIVRMDPEDDFKPFKMEDPDGGPTKRLAGGIVVCANKKWSIKRPDLDLSHCAKKYMDFFNLVINRYHTKQ